MARQLRKFTFAYQRKRNGNSPRWKLEQQGSLLAVACCDCHYDPQPGRRSTVEHFSAASRLRLLKKLARVAWREIGLTQFVTLTYPDEVADNSYPDRTQQRTLLFRWIEEQTNAPRSILWKVEWKPRKSGKRAGEVLPHLHICVFNCRYLDWLATSVRWGKLIGAAWVDVEGDRTRAKGVARYTSKYCSKDDESNVGLVMHHNSPRKPGRAWGWTRQELVPLDARIQVDELSEEQVERALRAAASQMGKEPKEGFSLFDDDAAQVAAFILGTSEEMLDDGIFPD